ncbi:Protein of unknown function (DUF2802) [Methylophaga frappieri]|uniref:DUF2802 domain-containing protein n=1 Tax=Methylophaga frappieri (strain ATCC BAA-2434 / DSM 25690 / JAM7) TaxID=754477 RepID=I1YHN0_METFJ|nr:DUF2802 domain-containing protein [Methylophaga frappieri]AFJ02423.1 Protein of unknown function (DUF2802) [Methylophaga frappieri]
MWIYSALGLIVLLFSMSLYRLYKLHKSQANEILTLQQQLAGLCAAAVGSDERVVAFERTLHQLKEQHASLAAGNLHQQGFDHAVRLARKGTSVGHIMESCNLSDEEARLISRLHGQQKTVSDLH